MTFDELWRTDSQHGPGDAGSRLPPEDEDSTLDDLDTDELDQVLRRFEKSLGLPGADRRGPRIRALEA